jgi:hypothetical protein
MLSGKEGIHDLKKGYPKELIIFVPAIAEIKQSILNFKQSGLKSA